MIGKYRIVVQNKRIRYDFEIKRNITIIRGDSATGKTTLVDMIGEFYENGTGSGIELRCDKSCAVIEGRTWEGQLSQISDSIVFIDEGNDFVRTPEFSSAIRNSDNYYVIVTREGISTLPYSVDEIYGIRNSGKYGSLKPAYNEFYHIYSSSDFGTRIKPDAVITEDSNSGYEFFNCICGNTNINCVSANGKSNIFNAVIGQTGGKILIIADGAAFGSEMEKIHRLSETRKDISLFLPESFEWLILSSGVVEHSGLNDVLDAPENYIDSTEFFSWERFFTAKLIEYTQDTFLKYSKRALNPVYLQDSIVKKIKSIMNGIEI